jgi:hypothetical protein
MRSVAGATYTFSVDLGFPKTSDESGMAVISIGEDDSDFSYTYAVAAPTTTATQESGNWVNYAARLTGLPNQQNSVIQILLSNSDPNDQAYFTDVALSYTLSASPTPESAARSMFLVGIAASGGLLRARRAKRTLTC